MVKEPDNHFIYPKKSFDKLEDDIICIKHIKFKIKSQL